MSIAQTDALLERCGGPRCDASAADDVSSANTLANVSNGAFIVGGVGVALGLIGVVLAVTTPEPAETPLRPEATASGLRWSFH
jgi:hypothetical protein